VSWIAFIAIIFCLPTANPVTSQTLNYTVVAVGIIAVFALGSWVVWAHRWFVGPVKDDVLDGDGGLGVDPLEAAVVEQQVDAEKDSSGGEVK
jgi:hypothetical protein